MKTSSFRKVMIGGLTMAMVIGGSASAFADGKKGNENGNGKNNGKGNQLEWRWSGYDKPGNGGKVPYNTLVNGNINIIFNFHDVKGGDVEWVTRNLASLAPLRVFEGYEDGSFQPRKTVTRIEAITAAVRLMGLREQAESKEEMSTELNFKDADKIAKKYPWAVGYVAVAAENDLFTETDQTVNPEAPASRLWATTLLVKAMKLEGEAKAKMNTKLDFRDANSIPAGSVGYVAVALERGLIDGYENNTFRPDKPVTRAELAALLDRTGDQLPGVGQSTVAGVVQGAVSDNKLTVKKGNELVQVNVDPNAFVFKDGKQVTAADIQKGDVVKVRLYNNTAIFIEVVKSGADQNQFVVNGLFDSLKLDETGRISSITVTQGTYGNNDTVTGDAYDDNVTKATYNVSKELRIIGDSSKLVKGQPVTLSGKDKLVELIQIHNVTR
ncbi:hypothetical protein J31TS4_45050 [Paenibacillus sp. J31TS4]|uniref:S-layer homology domain-containing protein n=1 Tax=Paenibacillus sp. J31TS4 TaxID=2807195 RepID=UPI001B00D191|nr:S-layer homology domain-containing protein [Paenibacillus sp. J31TS4]GIP41225.1 hypothetical protein J31TS4_45050 [Paenibacillus sp. J31TS4]